MGKNRYFANYRKGDSVTLKPEYESLMEKTFSVGRTYEITNISGERAISLHLINNRGTEEKVHPSFFNLQIRCTIEQRETNSG